MSEDTAKISSPMVDGEVRAAERLTADPEIELEAVAVHLRRAWSHLRDRADEDDDHGDLAAWAHRRLGNVGEAQEAVLDWVFGDEDDRGDEPSRNAVLRHIDALRELLPAPTKAVRGAADGLYLVGIIIGSLLLAAIVGLLKEPTGPWRGAYFTNQHFDGKPRVSHTPKLDFKWKAQPLPGMSKDRWSAIFDTCMNIKETTRVRFKMTSDDGSRLYVNGDRLIDNWGAHSARTRAGNVNLEPGLHHIRIEFFDVSHTAVLKLTAAFEKGAKAQPIPHTMLQQPAPGELPCA